MWAVASGNADAVGMPIEAGTDVGRADSDGLAALELARRKGRDEIAECLRPAGGS